MTDGPHKSLPMNRAWKRVAKNLANPNTSHAEINDLLCDALLTSEVRAFINQAQRVFTLDSHGSLFSGEPAILVAELRTLNICTAPAFSRNVMDYCAANLQVGRDSLEVLKGAFTYALRSDTESHFRGINEHWLREAPRAAVTMRRRCAEVGSSIDYQAVSNLALSLGKSVRPLPARRRTGLEEGVPL